MQGGFFYAQLLMCNLISIAVNSHNEVFDCWFGKYW
jgi:hypothetical protein